MPVPKVEQLSPKPSTVPRGPAETHYIYAARPTNPKTLACLHHRACRKPAQTVDISSIILVKSLMSSRPKSELAILKTVKIFGLSNAPRCQAKSKRSGVQCLKAAKKGKQVCRTHGAASTGPKTPDGRQRCAAAKTIHGWETRAIRSKRDAKLRELREIQRLMKGLGLIP
jgi:hypothetical protein